MRKLVGFFVLSATAPSVAFAHIGHIGELAGHDHWLAAAALSAAAALAALRALKGRKGQADAEDDTEEAPETEAQEA